MKKNTPLIYSPTCKFKVNPDFNIPLKKFGIPLLTFEQSDKSSGMSKESANILIDAIAVRIMKVRKSLPAGELSVQIKSQMVGRYHVSDRELQMRYEVLIDNAWIKREHEQNDVLFTYIG